LPQYPYLLLMLEASLSARPGVNTAFAQAAGR
jgi:hypothetical protein